MSKKNQSLIHSQRNLGERQVTNKYHKNFLRNLADDVNAPIDPMNLNLHEQQFKHNNNMVPVNVNYFIFSGQMHPESLSSLESIFKANNENNISQNQLFVIESRGEKNNTSNKTTPVPRHNDIGLTPGDTKSEIIVKQGKNLSF